MDEVEDAVAAWIEAGNERRPGHGTLRGMDVPNGAKPPDDSEPREIREPALFDERSCEVVVQAVEAEDDDTFAAVQRNCRCNQWATTRTDTSSANATIRDSCRRTTLPANRYAIRTLPSI